MRWFAYDFHSWLRHSWESLAHHLTGDQKIVIHGNSFFMYMYHSLKMRLLFLYMLSKLMSLPDSKVHGAIMGLTWGRKDPDGPHDGPMNLATWDPILHFKYWSQNFPGRHSHYHCCWCPGSLCHHIFSSYCINYMVKPILVFHGEAF